MFCRKKNHSRFFLLSIFSSSKIQGTFRSVGGMSSSMIYSGAAGTVYKYESRRGPQYRELKYNPNGNFSYFKPQHSKVKVDNEQINVATPSIIMEEDTIFYEFDEMQVSTFSFPLNQLLQKLTLKSRKLIQLRNLFSYHTKITLEF